MSTDVEMIVEPFNRAIVQLRKSLIEESRRVGTGELNGLKV